MSNSIWKTPDQKPESHAIIAFYVDGYLFTSYYEPQYSQYGIFGASKVEKWCYMKELSSHILALETELERTRKALDKAERLQKAVDNSREKLAAYMHDVWGNWFAYQLNNSTAENLQRWGIQSNTPYSSLTETDKTKDRRFADRIIEIIKEQIEHKSE